MSNKERLREYLSIGIEIAVGTSVRYFILMTTLGFVLVLIWNIKGYIAFILASTFVGLLRFARDKMNGPSN